jgi:parvulin-like peptidyl-prolyl isomerase
VNKIIIALTFLSISFTTQAQSVAQIKKALETSPNLAHYVKFDLHKKYKIDTIAVISITSFEGTPDSLAYFGTVGKVYGPYKGKDNNSYLIKILQKAPNTFYHVSHIMLDTAIFKPRFADSLANKIIREIKSGTTTFEAMASTYSNDNSTAIKGGDLGWLSLDVMLPQLSKSISRHKKGDIFKVWADQGLHIITITDEPKKDTGYALMLKVIL